MIWYAVIGVSLMLGYFTGFNIAQYLTSKQYERILRANAEQNENGLTGLRSLNAELVAQIEILKSVRKFEDTPC